MFGVGLALLAAPSRGGGPVPHDRWEAALVAWREARACVLDPVAEGAVHCAARLATFERTLRAERLLEHLSAGQCAGLARARRSLEAQRPVDDDVRATLLEIAAMLASRAGRL